MPCSRFISVTTRGIGITSHAWQGVHPTYKEVGLNEPETAATSEGMRKPREGNIMSRPVAGLVHLER
jgi:hypothetical protein